MSALNSIISPHFVDLYMSFLTSLLEASPKGLPEIYEFSAQYFENKLKERSGTKKNEKQGTIFQRDVPNSPGKKQFLPDFSYDSVLILPPKLFSPVISFEENKEHLLNKEWEVICRLNDSLNLQKQGRNSLSKLQAFHKNKIISRLANKDTYQDDRRQPFLEDQAVLKKERETNEKKYHDEKQEKSSESVHKDYKVQKEQKIILDLEKLLKEENIEKSMDHDGDRDDGFKILFKDFDVIDEASNTEVDQGAFQKCFCTRHSNHCDVFQKERKKNAIQKDQMEKQNIPPLDPYKNKMKLHFSYPERSKTLIDAQFSNESEVLNQIVEFSKVLPACLEVMSKMFHSLEERSNTPNYHKDYSYLNCNRQDVHDCLPSTLDEACENDADKQKTIDKMFHTTASQTDMVGNLELMKIDSSVSTPAMLAYIYDVLKAAKRLLHSAVVKNYNHLQIEKITEDLFMSKEGEIGFNEIEKILEFCRDCLNKRENSPFRVDRNCIHKLPDEEYSDSRTDYEENKNAWQYESSEERQNGQAHRKSSSIHDVGKDFNHPCDHETAQNTNRHIYSPVQEEICQESEKSRGERESGKGIRKKDQNNGSSSESYSNKESSNHSYKENKKILDDMNNLEIGCRNGDLSKSISDSIISSHSSHDANKNDLAKAFLSKLENIYQTYENHDSTFSSSPGVIQISAHEPVPKETGKTFKSTGDLNHKQTEVKSKPVKLPKGKNDQKEKESLSLLDPRRSSSRKEKENIKNLLDYYKIHYNGYPNDKRGERNHEEKPVGYESSSETDEDIKENAGQTLADSEQRGPIHTDHSPFFISTPGKLIQNNPEPVAVKKTAKSSGDLSKKSPVQRYGPRKKFRKMSPPKDKSQDPSLNGFYSLLDPKRSITGEEVSYPKLFKDAGSTALEDEIDDEDSSKIVVHEIHQATSKLQMRILKARRVYKKAESKTRADRDAKSLDDNWRDTGVPVTGRSWLRSYFTTRMIRKYQKQLETDKMDNGIEDLSTPVLKHHECSYSFGSYFSQRSLFGNIRLWYFSRKLREYEKTFHS